MHLNMSLAQARPIAGVAEFKKAVSTTIFAGSRVLVRWRPLVQLSHAVLQRGGIPAVCDEPRDAIAANKAPHWVACATV